MVDLELIKTYIQRDYLQSYFNICERAGKVIGVMISHRILGDLDLGKHESQKDLKLLGYL